VIVSVGTLDRSFEPGRGGEISIQSGFTLGDWTVYPLEGRLVGEEGERRIQPKSMDVLLCLAEHAGAVAQREDILRHVWGERAQNDEPLTRCIGELRRSLDDTRAEPNYILTVPKRGYRLLKSAVPLVSDDASADDSSRPADSDVLQIAEPRKKLRLDAARVIAIAIVVLLAVALTEVFFDRVPDNSDSGVGGDDSSRPEAITGAAQDRTSIAVLPFVNMSADKEQEYFADGLSEEVLNLLAQTRGLKVTARTSSFAFKGQNRNISEIAEILNVSTVLEGSVRRADNRLRINAKLINAADGYNLWSESYDREMADVFELQEDIAAEIITALSGQLHAGEMPTRGRPTDNMEAYNIYLQGLHRVRADDFVAAKVLFGQAIELAPDFAEAHEQLAISWWSVAGGILEMPGGMAEAHREAAIALELNPNLGHARTVFFVSDMSNYDRLLELQSFEQLVREQPQNSKARTGLIYTLLITGYFREALAAGQELVANDPFYGIGHVRLGEALYATGSREAARKEWQTASNLNVLIGHWYAAVAAILAGDDHEATEYMSRVEWHSKAYIDRFPTFMEAVRKPGGVYKLISETKATNRGYLDYGFLFVPLGMIDEAYEYFELLGAFRGAQTNAEYAIEDSTILIGTGFTAHPRYVELATAYGLASVWDRRGPPDHCEKINGNWSCR
jgi:TolB-like protein/DNA-binding winged helix-turn-helix (wHTH) protein